MPLCTLLALTTAALRRDLDSYTHDQYVRDFAKQYNAAEKLRRAAVFAENVVHMRRHNAEGHGWFTAPNEFMDWTNDEFRAQRVMTGHRPPSPLRVASVSASDPPASVDWRTKDGVITAVKDQKSCGSCWAFAAVETFESQVAIVSGKAAPVLSEQQVVSCSLNPDHCGGTGGCQGSTQQLAFNYTAANGGITTEAAYPYTGKTGTCDTTKITAAATNTGVVTVKPNDYTAHVDALANVGPLAITVAAGGLGWQLYGGGIFKGGSGLMGCNANLDHGVQLVGYGSDAGQDYWIVRNSWGPSWGESGFIRLKRFGEGNEPCQIDTKPADGIACSGDTEQKSYCGSCGMLSSSSYPTGVKAV